MNPHPSRLIAVVGGSGAGKTWLAERLEHEFSPDASRLSLDDFYHDFSHVAAAHRQFINFDDPSAIDWLRVESVLRDCRAGRRVSTPHYDFVTHTRRGMHNPFRPKSFVLVEGLWLLWRPSIRALFDLRIYLDCPAQIRWRQRLARDVAERGRTADSVREQFWTTVAPMHERFVAPQTRWADIVLQQPLAESEIRILVARIRERLAAIPPRARSHSPMEHKHHYATYEN
jgi:uridine kinase